MTLATEGSLRVLHADADPACIDLASAFLAKADDRFTVVSATTPGEALERLDDVACVVSEYDLPGMDGIDLLESVRDERPDLLFIIFTDSGSEAVASEAIAAGVTDYIPKGRGQYATLAERIQAAVHTDAGAPPVETLCSYPGDYTCVLDTEGTITYVTPAVEHVLGASPTALSGTTAFESVHANNRRAVLDAFEAVTGDADERTVSARVEHTDGSWRWLEMRFRDRLADPRVDGVLAHVRDITDLQDRRRELDRYRTLVQTAGDAMYALDEEGYITMVNSSHVEWSGYSEGELVGTHVSEFLPAAAIEEGIDLTVELLKHPDKQRARFEFPATRPDGEERIYEDNIAVLTDEDGDYSGSIGVIRDITERKRRVRALERQNERLDNFANIISHDIRNPLQVASGNLEVARRTGDEAAFENVDEAHERIDSIIDDVLTIARHGRSVETTTPTDINEVARDAWVTVDTHAMDLKTDGHQVLAADAARLRQLFENLFRNAAEHAGPETTVTVGPIEPMHTSTRASTGGDGFYVADDGPGIPPEMRDDVLDFGVTTSSDGTGFGLAIVSQIADAHGWETSVTESGDGGTRFEFVTTPVS